MAISPQQISFKTRQFTKQIASDFENKGYDKCHFSFNGSQGQFVRILLEPNKKTNIQSIKHKLQYSLNRHRARSLWTIIQKFSLKEWENLMKYSNSGQNSLLFDCLLYNSRRSTWSNYPLFNCRIPEDKSFEYKIIKEQLVGDCKWLFKEVGMKIVKKEDMVVVVIKLLESGFYKLCHYEVAQ